MMAKRNLFEKIREGLEASWDEANALAPHKQPGLKRAKLKALREALMKGLDSGPAVTLDTRAFTARKRTEHGGDENS